MEQVLRASAVAIAICTSVPALAGAQVFEGSYADWQAAVAGSPVITITFDTIAGSMSTPIAGNEFAAFPGQPVFASVIGDGVYVGNPAADQIPVPPSAPNMLAPNSCTNSCKGVVRLTFASPMRALGATFIDVENEYALTGYSLVPGAAAPTINFSRNPGDRSFEFLGFVTDTPFSSVDIYLTTGTSIDGSLLDNLVYAPVPEPSSLVLLGCGVLVFALRSRRRGE